MAAHVLDTNVVSELTQRAPSPAVTRFLADTPDLLLSVIVFHELEFGIHCVADMRRRAKLQSFSLALHQQFAGRIVDVDTAIAQTAGRLRAFEKGLGRILAEFDALIAATAMVKGATLVTRNVRDFEMLSLPLLDPWAYAG